MRLGYGYNKKAADFKGHGCDTIFLDYPGTQREERHLLFLKLDGGQWCELFLAAPGDLGRGAEVARLIYRLNALGVAIVHPDKPLKERGRPAKFNPDPEDDRRLRKLWKSAASPGYVLDKASEVTGSKVEKHQLIYRYGNRT